MAQCTAPFVRTHRISPPRHAPPPVPVAWEWIFLPVTNPDTGATVGYLRIGQTAYCVSEIPFTHHDGSAGRLWRLLKPDQTVYQVVINPATSGGLECDCPDATFRDRACKHAV